jgi:trans-2,3-dihydro-3-hydroxyanthranilate isomerase
MHALAANRRVFLTALASPLAAAKPQSPQPRTLDYEVWDVFSHRPLYGNQLGVFFNANQLDTPTMLRITREMNFSECTFLERRDAATEAAQGIRTRIFLRTGEIPFAGHPTLGTAFALFTRARKKPARITLHLNAGQVPVDFTQPTPGSWQGMMTQPEPVFAETHPHDTIAPLLGTTVDALDTNFPIQNVSTGRPNLIVMFRSLAALQKVQYNWPAILSYFAQGDPQRSFYLITRETREAAPQFSNRQFHTRKIANGYEDPVTGSAAWLVHHGLLAPDALARLEQGTEIDREGQALIRASRKNNTVTNVQVGGASTLVMRGQFFL